MPTYTAGAEKAIAATAQTEGQSSSAQLSNGSRVVVYNVTTTASDSSVLITPYAQLLDASGNKVGSPIQLFASVATADGYGSTTDGALATGVSALADGTIVVAGSTYKIVPNVGPIWTVYNERLGSSGQILATTEMHSWDANGALDVKGGDVLVAPDGSYYVEARVIEKPVPQIQYLNDLQHYSASGGAAGSMFGAGVDYGDFPSTTVMSSGNVLTASFWVSSSIGSDSILIDLYGPNGDAVAHQVIQSPDIDRNVPSAANLGAGQGIVIWHEFTRTSDRTESMHAQIVDGAGNLVGSPFAIALPIGQDIHLTSLAGGSVLASWEDGGTWHAQSIGANGQLDGAVFTIGSNVTEITATADGGFLVESSRSGDVFEQKFDVASATASGGDINVNGGTTAIPAGNYDIHGGAGVDQILFAGAHTQYTVTQDSVSGPEGTDTLSGIERVRFDDGYAVALDVNGDAGQAYRLYQAAFHRAPDLPGLGFQMNDLDMGYSLAHVAQNFIDSPEFQATYGPGLSNTEFITLLYRNVLNREPEQAGLDYHLNEFAQGETRAGMLTHFSEAPENQAHVIGQIQNGMLFVPYA